MTFDDLLALDKGQLDDLFRRSPAGPIPEGAARGIAIACAGTWWARWISGLVRRWAWQGKVFTPNPDGQGATLENRITAAGVQAIVARVYYTESWLDGRECIVLDYSKTSLLARKIRDEIRLIDPERRLYLGKVWWGKTRLIDFALEFPA
ncbi:MAG TPA: hypothetical protein VMN36_16105 [Verrucomicrobiales bacterium]|nr:hypothetical protein [Verrucomicrobiales bacterium]